jgi:hypothetical protein
VQDVKQFARCMNCRQWYIQTFTTAVEIYQGGHLHRVMVWCLRCIDEAEQRSQPVGDRGWEMPEARLVMTTSTENIVSDVASTEDFQQLMQEHLDLMDRAIHEDDAVLVPLVEDFMQRCHLYQQHLNIPEQSQRLVGHLQYWEAFLKALNQSLNS